MERQEETEERHARRDERKPEEGKRSGWKRDAEYKRGRIGGARSTDTTEPRRRFVGEAREGRGGGRGGGRVSGARSLSDTLRRTDRSPPLASGRAKTSLVS